MNNPEELAIRLEAGAATTALAYEASASDIGGTLILGHGAGAGQRSAFMVEFARSLAALGIQTTTFNFPYTEARRKLPDRRPVLDACYRSVIEAALRALYRPRYSPEKVASVETRSAFPRGKRQA